MQSSNIQRRADREILYENGSACTVKRNPYLVDFEIQRSQGRRQKTHGQALDSRQRSRLQPEVIRPERNGQQMRRGSQNRKSPYAGTMGNAPGGAGAQRTERAASRAALAGTYRKRAEMDIEADMMPRRQPSRSRNGARRSSMALMRKALVGVWVFCILVLAVTFMVRNGRVAAGKEEGARPDTGKEGAAPQYSGYLVQGLPAEEFAKHPVWTEDFLTVNEYSRPGDPLETVNNIFVHYTANPGTSAAQNRSYFEWLKDTHETSASAHFIIGYEGEIIQCVPLDEIAYAVQSRNGDSVSIECCYLEEDGSFTPETYDSLLSLLAWLTDVYDLETEDILRHYDCGGKKCPLYYTEHPDAWEELKKDVDKL